MTGRAVLTAAEMRAAEARSIEAGTPAEMLMERAGRAAAESIWRFAGPAPALILCGPGNNGGDGYVIARLLGERGVDVRVAALGEPATPAAAWARARWDGEVVPLDEARPAPLLVDALFGTGLKRPLEEAPAQRLAALASAARLRIAVDLPSGAGTDDGALLSPVPDYELTITFQTLKPSHLLQPAARHMGKIVVADIGVEAESMLFEVARPRLVAPGPADHKYTRGAVGVVAGEMPGAAALAAAAAARSGAGYVRLLSPAPIGGVPSAVVQQPASELRAIERMDMIVAGPGFGRSAAAAQRLDGLLASGRPMALDADAIGLLAEPGRIERLPPDTTLTPHAGEFERLFGPLGSDRIAAARAAAQQSNAVVLLKGPDTIVAAPDGRAAIARPPHWLATAGTGDVLAGIVAAMYAHGFHAWNAACAAVWLHARAALFAGPAFVADDLLAQLRPAMAECL
ncbi:MAG TPA: NAD(P)H-hydrate dehydratase [Allosphingosinicella sp.]